MNKLFELFKPASPLALATKELEEAQRELLAAQSAADYALNMCAYNSDRIGRLTKYLRAQVEGQS